MFNFQKDLVNLGSDILTTYKGKNLILKNVHLYNGPVTMQLLPYGGIQSVFNYNLIIYTKSGFIVPESVIYDNKEMTTKDFILNNSNLVNYVLGR